MLPRKITNLINFILNPEPNDINDVSEKTMYKLNYEIEYLNNKENWSELHKIPINQYDSDSRYWSLLSWNSNLSEDFIREFKDYLNWCAICSMPLSESFMEEMHEWLDWETVSECQKFSQAFYNKFKDKITIPELMRNENIKIKINIEIL
jgi:viroplasmin and RNaseH domain-containing protein